MCYLSTSDETLILVTADHSHSFTHSGYVNRGNPIFGFQSSLAMDGKPALTLSYADGPVGLTGNQTRANLTGVNYNDTNFQQQALVKRQWESHAAEDVGQFLCIPVLFISIACWLSTFFPITKSLRRVLHGH